jgi:NADH dehydrogenase (ubiquinone) Fe-S protein 1
MPAAPGMNIKTETPLVKKAREGVMEFLLANHPLDCPICDQGGECDLQDQAMSFGSDRGRFTEMKRSVVDKNLGPLVKTVMTRCIHCTRCVRFAKEVAGIQDLGITGRGRDAEVGTYVQKTMASELSGNVIDLCPVGALTSKPAAFTYRNWELRTTDSVDTSDALGSNIRVDARGLEVMRILPRLNDDVNQEWISDKTRFQYDGLRYQRLTAPMIRGKNGQLAASDWEVALAAAGGALQGVKGSEIRAIAGKLADAESMVALKDLMNRLGCGDLRHEAGFSDLDADARSNYLFNSTLKGVDSADLIVLIGTNPRKEAPVLNARIRAAVIAGTPVALVGAEEDLTYAYEHLGDSADALDTLVKPSSEMLKRLKAAQNPMIIVGAGVLKRQDRDGVLARVHKLVEKAGVVKEGWNGYNVLHDTAGRVAALDVGFLPSARVRSAENGAASPKVVYLLGSDDFDETDVPEDAFVIYQGHHGDRGAERANVILPATAFTEKWGLFVNTEGRPQSTRTAVPSVADARDDWKVVRALSEVVGKQLPYDTFDDVRERVAEVAPHLGVGGEIQPALWLNGEYFKAFAERAKKVAVSNEALATSVTNFYQTDAISRASKTMARCVKAQQQQQN